MTNVRTLRVIMGLATASLITLAARAQTATEPVGRSYVYKTVNGRSLRLWVYASSGKTDQPGQPAVLFFHGGGWVAGPVSQFNRQAQYLAGRGMVAIQVEYRLVPMRSKKGIGVCIEDAQSAVRWVRMHAGELGVTPDRIAAAGGSAGGQLAAFLGLMSGFNAPGDNLHVSARANAMVLLNPAIDLGPESTLYGRGGSDYRAVSPRYHVHRDAPPALILQGESDTVVSPAMIRRFAKDLVADGGHCTLTMYPHAVHGFFNSAPWFSESLRRIDDFFVALGWIHGSVDETLLAETAAEPPPSWN